MKHYIYKFIIIAVIFILILFVERYYTNQQKQNIEYIQVLVTNKHIIEGTKIEGDMFELIKVLKSKQSKQFIVNSDSLIGKYAKVTIEKDQFLYINQFMDKIDYSLDDNKRLLTIKLNIEESNGWHLQKGQIVDIVVISENELTETVITNVKVYKVFDEKLREIENPFFSEFLPQYISIVLREDQLSHYLLSKQNSKVYVSVK